MKFEIIKTVSYDLRAEVDTDEASTAQELIDLLEREGDAWVEYEQSDGQDEVVEVFAYEESNG